MRVLIAPLGDPGFLYPALAVGRRLRARGHSVWVLGEARSAAQVTAAGLAFLDSGRYPVDRPFRTHRWFLAGRDQYLAVRAAARETAADAVLTSMLCHGALLAAEALDLPCVVLGLAAHLWPYRPSRDSAIAAEDERVGRSWRLAETLRFYAQAREQAGLPRRVVDQSVLHGAGLLLRGAPALEMPGARLPHRVRHVGGCWWEPAGDATPVLARLDRVGKPVVYVHLGRTFGGRSLWPRLNELFTGGRYQAVVECGRSGAASAHPDADLTVVREPWLAPLVRAAELVLTNATSAPVLAALRHDRPLVVAPNGSEQPVLAAACVRAGVGVELPERVDAATLGQLATGERPVSARALCAAVVAGDDGALAADSVEAAIGSPVTVGAAAR